MGWKSCRLGRLGLAALVLLLAVWGGSARVRAQSGTTGAPTIENIRLGFGPLQVEEARQNDWYKVGSWIPVTVDLKAGASPFQGEVELFVPDEDGTPTSIRERVFLQAHELRSFQGRVRPGTKNAEVTARLLDGEGKLVGRSLTVGAFYDLDPSSLVVATLGQPSGVEAVPSLAKFQSNGPGTPDLVVGTLQTIPADWLDLDAVETIVLETSSDSVLERLRTGGDRVLKEWVAQGGHLVVAVGANWQQAIELLGPMLPAVPSGPARLNDLGAVESFSSNATHPIQPPMTVIKLEDWASRGGVPLAAATASPLVVRGPYGFGRVTITGIDVAHRPFSAWEDRRLFWDKVLDIRSLSSEDAASSVSMSRGALIQTSASDLAARLHQGLEQFPGVKLVPFGWVAFFVFLYILLIGPGDYLFLRKVLKRMELTWVTFPLIVFGVSLLAYLGAYAVKGNELRVNKLDAIDFDQTTGAVRGRSWMTVFSPQNRDYGVSFHPLSPRFDGQSPLEVESNRVSWFASPEPRFAGSGGRITLAGSGYAYGPPGKANELEGVRIAIWSTKSFSGRWTGHAPQPVVETDLQPVGGDRISGSIRNLLDLPLKNAQLYYGKNVYDLGTIRPRGIARVDPTRTEATARYLGRIAQSFDRGMVVYGPNGSVAGNTGFTMPRADVVRAAMFHDAMGTRGALYPSRSLRALDLTGQVVELLRPMLVAEVDAPAARLELRNAPGTPQQEQTTLLRVLLPVTADDGAAK